MFRQGGNSSSNGQGPSNSGPGDDAPAPGVRERSDLDADDLNRLESLTGGSAVWAVVDSDLLFSGQYGHNQLILCEDALFVIEDDQVARTVALDDVAAAYCKDFVGNGVLEVRLSNDRQIELLRYSKTISDACQEIARRVNNRISVSEDELEAHAEEVAKVAGPKDHGDAYRCPNCGHPLRTPSDACPRCTKSGEVMLRLAREMRHHWKLALAGMLLSMLFTAMTLAPGLLVRELVDGPLRPVEEVTEPETGTELYYASQEAAEQDRAERRRHLYGIVALFAGFVVVRGVAAYYRIRTMGTLGSRVITDLRDRLFRTFQRLSLSYYDREHTGRIMARLLTDAREVQRFVVQGIQQLVIHLLTIVGIMVILFYWNWQLAAIALLPIPVVVLFSRYFSRKFRAIFRSLRRKFAAMSGTVNEVLSGMRVVKSFGQEEREISGFNRRNLNVHNARIQAVMARSRFGPVIGLLIRLGVVAVWLIGGLQVVGGTVSLGTLMLFITYMNQFYNPVRQLVDMVETFQESATAAERIFDIMDMPSEVSDHENALTPATLEGKVEFEDVSFGYSEGERVLKHINLKVEPGEMIGLVGQTGSGKSTLASLVCRFYDPTHGRILIDGHDLHDLKLQWLRQNIGMVLQDPFLFAGTVRDNIAYGKQDASEAEIIQAAMAANAHEFIMNLPDGYDTPVGERGVMLSGGEKQRVSIARAILKNPAILILDEATSAVDTVTEALIQEAMDRLVENRTTFAIAHRLSTLRNADRLIVLEDGEIAEQGSHEELMASNGMYAELCRTQAEFATRIKVS